MYSASISSTEELPEISFELSHKNQEGIVVSYGPKNGFLWRGEPFDSEKGLIESLNKVFQEGFTQQDEQSSLAKLPYIQSLCPDFICASNTYISDGELVGFDNEQTSAGNYGYIYLIDTDEKNKIESIPLCEENLLNKNFVAGYRGEIITEGPDYAVISKVDPKCIIGAMPSPFVAFALGIPEQSFITNPAYKGIIYCGKIKKCSDITSFYDLSALSSVKYPDLSMEEIYQNYLEADEMAAAQSCSSSTSSTVVSPTFFPSPPPDSTSANEYNHPYQCGK
jgi:hypothetical protein